MRGRLSAILCAALLLPGAAARAQAPPTLDTVIGRMRAYLTNYSEQYSATLATERYRQTTASTISNYGIRETYLESSFGIIRLPEPGQWQGFRDVYRVDGRTIADREDRLAKLFNDPRGMSPEQGLAIAEESARFNIGPAKRTINNPALVFEMFAPSHLARLFFAKVDEDSLDGVRVWVLTYSEEPGPTLVRGSNGEYEPSEGRVWVEPISGRLHRADIQIDIPFTKFRETISVTFRPDPRLPFWVPAKLVEKYEGPGLDRVGGEATYTDYRLFGVSTQEDFGGRTP